MRALNLQSVLLVAALLVGGCIVSDELTTITIQPDGSADWVRFQSNIRSTEKGAKGEQELRRFVASFDAHSEPGLARVLAAGGTIGEARWVRPDEPFATVATAQFSSAKVLKNFWTTRDKNGKVVAEPQFTQDGSRRRFSISLSVPQNERAGAAASRSCEQILAQQADSISRTRIVVAGGQIVASQGFTVASDKRSCVLSLRQIEELVRSHPAQVELFLEWELDDE